MGAVSSGKSSACAFEIFQRAIAQEVGKNGIAMTKWAVIRSTEPKLTSTTMRTWSYWFPEEDYGKINWATPISHHFRITAPDIKLPASDGAVKRGCLCKKGQFYHEKSCPYTPTTKVCDIEVLFLAIDGAADIGKLKSLELTGAWINEAQEMNDIIVMDTLWERCRRFPPQNDRPEHIPQGQWPTWSGVWVDYNPPNVDHWLYDYFENKIQTDPEVAEMAAIFHQPSGLSPEAENKIGNHPDYYKDLVKGKEQWWIDVNIHGKYGYSRDGKPVYSNYNDAIHCAKEEIFYNKLSPLIIGIDFGLNCSAVICQQDMKGRFIILEELISEMGIRQFIETMLKPTLRNKYMGCKVIVIGDPSGNNRVQTDERTCYDELRAAGIPAEPSITNAIQPRIGAVNTLLTGLVEGKPRFQMNARCSVLREGFNSKYRFKKKNQSGDAGYLEDPEKNHPWSDIHDCVQYACLYAEGEIQNNRPRAKSKKISKLAWT